MNRIQILLQPETHKRIKMLAKIRKTSVSKFVREVVIRDIERDHLLKDVTMVLRDAAKKAFVGGPKDLSTKDDYLYEVK